VRGDGCVPLDESQRSHLGASAAKMAEAAREVGAALLVVPVDATSAGELLGVLARVSCRSC